MLKQLKAHIVPRHWRTMILCVVLAQMLVPTALGQPHTHWESGEFKVVLGTATREADGLRLQADANGQIYFTLPANGLRLERFPLVSLDIAQGDPAAGMVLIWRNSAPGAAIEQVRLPGGGGPIIRVSMEGDSRWRGSANLLAIGVNLPPGRDITLRSVSIASPTLLTKVADLFHEWSSHKPWAPVDVNLYTGTRAFNQGIHPVIFFTATLGLCLLAYILLLLGRRKLASFDWRIAGVLGLACWIALDLFWQLRLTRQVQDTHATFAGKSSDEKLLASEDQPIVEFISRVKEKIDTPEARVFLGSTGDGYAMSAAYYLAPVNTYWHRNGPELPQRKYLASGDYVLLVAPSLLRFHPEDGTLLLPDGEKLAVDELLREPVGTLLRVQ